MELVRETIHMIRRKGRAVSQLTLDDDYNIPEAKPDAGTIVQEKGKIEVEEVKAENGRVLIRGALQFAVLYLDDSEESSLHSVKGQIPFEESMNAENVSDGDSLKLDWTLEDVSAVLINSRKLGIRTVATLELSIEELVDGEVPVDAEGTAGVRIRTCPLSAAGLAVRKRDTCRVKDEIILPANKPNIRQVIWEDTLLQGTELRLADGEVLIQGELSVFLLYEGEEDEKAGWIEQTLPFSSRVDAAGCREGMAGGLKLELADADLEIGPDHDGELRVIHIEALLSLDIRIYQEETLDIVCDLYHPRLELAVEREPLSCERLLVSSVSRCRVPGRLKTDSQEPAILQLCHGRGEVRVDDCRMTQEGLLAEGAVQVQVLYVTADDSYPMLCLKGSVPFEHRVEAPGADADSTYCFHASLEQLSVDMVSSTELEIRASVLISALVFSRQTVDCITGAAESAPDPETLKALPAFLIYAVQPADTLWDVAKACRTTTERIRELNALESEELTPGQKLIIMKELYEAG